MSRIMTTRVLLAAAAGWGFAGIAQAATVLTFTPYNQFETAANNNGQYVDGGGHEIAIDQTYGSRVSNSSQGGYSYGGAADTPHVTVAYSPEYSGGDLSGVRVCSPVYGGEYNVQAWGGYSQTVNFLYNAYGAIPGDPTGQKWIVTFTADAGYQVHLSSFEMASQMDPGGNEQIDIFLNGSPTAAWSQSIALPNNTASAPVLIQPDIWGQQIVLQMTDPVANYSAATNFTFSESPVPEPATMSLLTLGASLVLVRRRQK